MSYVELESVVKSYGSTRVLHGVDLDIDQGEFAVFVGPSGCGKTTLLRTIAGLEELDSGSIKIGGERIDILPPSKRGIAMVFQNYALYPHMSVFENMSFGLRLAKTDKTLIRKRVKETAEILQISDYLDRRPKALSGGQRQRVAIGRAIIQEPNVFLFDEPLSNLDAKLRVKMRVELARLHQRLKTTMIYVTHDQVEAMTMADKIVILNQGNIEQVGRPLDLYNYPKNRFVAEFIGSPAMNFLKAKIIEVQDRAITVDVDGGSRIPVPCKPDSAATVGAPVLLGIRPESMTLNGESAARITGAVDAVERLGNETYLYVTTMQGEEITVHTAGDEVVRSGDTIDIGFDAAKCHLFQQAGPAFERVTA
ncbi:MAG: sn-glycerol-3-phosphate ABC transporter ATP-binding protein UgpC [Alphaproteobacteria bacterium]